MRSTLLRRRGREVWGLGRLVGTSPAMQDVHRMIELAAQTPAPVLIVSESGTGKELVARTLHALSPRAEAPFLAVNCSAIPGALLESEIFGYEKGAFTGALEGALERRIECFQLAHGGTLSLDELAEMSPALPVTRAGRHLCPPRQRHEARVPPVAGGAQVVWRRTNIR